MNVAQVSTRTASLSHRVKLVLVAFGALVVTFILRCLANLDADFFDGQRPIS